MHLTSVCRCCCWAHTVAQCRCMTHASLTAQHCSADTLAQFVSHSPRCLVDFLSRCGLGHFFVLTLCAGELLCICPICTACCLVWLRWACESVGDSNGQGHSHPLTSQQRIGESFGCAFVLLLDITSHHSIWFGCLLCQVRRCRVSRCGTRIISCADDSSTVLCDMTTHPTPTPIARLQGHSTCVCFCLDALG